MIVVVFNLNLVPASCQGNASFTALRRVDTVQIDELLPINEKDRTIVTGDLEVPDAVRGYLDEAFEAVGMELLEATFRGFQPWLVELGVVVDTDKFTFSLISIEVTNVTSFSAEVVDFGIQASSFNNDVIEPVGCTVECVLARHGSDSQKCGN